MCTILYIFSKDALFISILILDFSVTIVRKWIRDVGRKLEPTWHFWQTMLPHIEENYIKHPSIIPGIPNMVKSVPTCLQGIPDTLINLIYICIFLRSWGSPVVFGELIKQTSMASYNRNWNSFSCLLVSLHSCMYRVEIDKYSQS